MWIKICGITSLEDAEQATAAGADAIGFVFAESPRRVTSEIVRTIVERLSSPVEKIGVFVDASLDEMACAHRAAGLTGVQMHDSHRTANLTDLRARIGDASRVLKVIHYGGNAAVFAAELRSFHNSSAKERQQDAILIDTWISGSPGGTGTVFDWAEARANFLEQSPHLQLIAAGGLNPENVRKAIHTLRPWGVDVSSGVEARPGKKDPQRVAEFIHAAREAWTELGKTA